jgi:hypothetical protein
MQRARPHPGHTGIAPRNPSIKALAAAAPTRDFTHCYSACLYSYVHETLAQSAAQHRVVVGADGQPRNASAAASAPVNPVPGRPARIGCYFPASSQTSTLLRNRIEARKPDQEQMDADGTKGIEQQPHIRKKAGKAPLHKGPVAVSPDARPTRSVGQARPILPVEKQQHIAVFIASSKNNGQPARPHSLHRPNPERDQDIHCPRGAWVSLHTSVRCPPACISRTPICPMANPATQSPLQGPPHSLQQK